MRKDFTISKLLLYRLGSRIFYVRAYVYMYMCMLCVWLHAYKVFVSDLAPPKSWNTPSNNLLEPLEYKQRYDYKGESMEVVRSFAYDLFNGGFERIDVLQVNPG